jgi:group I intron endonuclease
MNNYLIYKHTSPSGKSYIGQTNNYKRRCNAHKHKSSQCLAFAKAINKHTWDAFTHEILHENLTIEQANELEAKLIAEHNTLAPNGYNLRSGGLNSTHSVEARAKMSLANLGKSKSPEGMAKRTLSRNAKTFEKLKQQYLQVMLTKDNYSANQLANILIVTAETIINHLKPTTRTSSQGSFIIPTKHIHNYFNQPNPYITLDKSAAMC